MCLIAFNWMDHPVYKLVLVANRDEFYVRRSESLGLWKEGFYAGKDVKEGGTWMGFHPNGKFAALTNYRDIPNEQEGRNSRGELAKNFLMGNLSPKCYVESLESIKYDFNGYNLLVADEEEMYYSSNYMEGIVKVPYGLHGLSNALLNVPWPKVSLAKINLSSLLGFNKIELDDLLSKIRCKKVADDFFLPKTGLEYTMERALSAQFIEVKDYYGTVNSTAVLWTHEGRVQIKECRFVPEKTENVVEFVTPTS